MRIAYLDCFSGISGDMFLGALLDAGLPPKLFEETVSALNIRAVLETSRANRSGISATKVGVIVKGEKDSPRESRAQAPQEHAHGHEHHHGEAHHRDSHAHQDPHGRGLTEIREIVQHSKISDQAKAIAIAIFEKLGTVESKIHDVPIEEVHFHEVGAVDALVDIVCAAVGADALGVDEFACSPLNVGGGTVNCAHGTFPVPAPATVELLKGAPVYSSGLQSELVTPTGAAIVATLVKRFAELPALPGERQRHFAHGVAMRFCPIMRRR